MPSLTLSYEELEALHDVLEAARCYWYPQQHVHARAAKALRLANSLYWKIGEYLPKTGTPSERYQQVKSSSQGDRVEHLLDFIIDDLTKEYANVNDPWWADTVFASSSLATELSKEELRKLQDSLERLGLILEFRSDIPHNRMVAARQNLGPWRDEVNQ
jgi:hypothetical protein